MTLATLDAGARRTGLSGLRSARPSNVAATQRHLAWPVRLLLVSLFIPLFFKVGPLTLTPYRVVLLAMFVPCVILWLSGKAGRIRAIDIALVLYCVWCAISLAVLHGMSVVTETGGILMVETMSSYLIARCYIRDATDFRNMVWLLFVIVALLFPLAALEALSGHDIMIEAVSNFAPTHVLADPESRWGLRRVQSVFEHPILFGVCCASAFALTHMVLGYGQSTARRWAKSGVVGATAFLSLSAGPILALVVQGGMMGWNWVLRNVENRWKIFGALGVAGYVFIEMVSNQSAPAFIISHFNFDGLNAYYRILIWEYGTGSVLNHPYFGVGLGEWDRPHWMPPSIDMFWLIHAVKYGIPASIFMAAAVLLAFQATLWRTLSDDREVQYRTAYLIVLCGYIVVGFSVHFWNATYVLFLFILGSGYWMRDVDAADGARAGRGSPRQSRRGGARRGREPHALRPKIARTSAPEPARAALRPTDDGSAESARSPTRPRGAR